ncbi:MAG: YdeI/OmpD-associated family protein [Bacteroidota bacterium]|nr:YdeI/OmpD-associated family protein [Bacteroidota bacterium]
MKKFCANIDIVGINPFVYLPDNVINFIFRQAKKDKGPIRVKGTINERPYKQTLVKYSGAWRLYINTSMLKNSPKRIGEMIMVTIEFDPSERIITMNPKLEIALNKNPEAKIIFDTLTPSTRLEIIRYLSFLKSKESVDKNVIRAINFLLGNGRFIGRGKL